MSTNAYVAPHIAAIKPYRAGSSFAIEERHGEQLIRMASNESPWGPSAEIMAAIAQQLGDTPLNRYPDAAATELCKDIATHHKVNPDCVRVGHGSSELIDLACRSYATPQDHAIIGLPSFSSYPLYLQAANVPYTEVPLRDYLGWDVETLLAAVKPNTRLMFIANPNNPTGAHLNRMELQRLINELPDEVLLVMDEAYVDFVTDADFSSALELRQQRDRLLILRTFSKAYGLASLRIGYAIGQASWLQYLDHVRLPFNTSALAQTAARAALQNHATIQRQCQLIMQEREKLAKALTQASVEVAPSQANFLLIKPPGNRAGQVYQGLLDEGIVVRPLSGPASNWLRVTISLPEHNTRFLHSFLPLCQ